MKDYLEWVGIGSDNNEFGDASVESFSGLVGTLLDLLERSTLGDQVVYFGGEVFSSERSGSFGDFLSRGSLTIC